MSRSSQRPEGGKPARASWRGSGKPPPRDRGDASWRTARAQQQRRPPSWLAGVALAVVAVVLLAAFGYYVAFRPVPTPLVCIYVTDYEPPLPPQAFAQEDVEHFANCLPYLSGFNAGNISVGPDHLSRPLAEADRDTFLDHVRRRVARATPNGGVVLVYLNAQGMVDSSGRPCLILPASPAGDDPPPLAAPDALPASRLVHVADVLDALETANPKATNVVLLLDAVRWDRNWRLGIAANEFMERLEEECSSSSRKTVSVLSATSPGEISLVDPIGGYSLFADALARGLWGEADATVADATVAGGNGDGEVSLPELSAFVQSQVVHAASRRGRSQEPNVLGSLPNVILCRAERSAIPVRAVPSGSGLETLAGDEPERLPARWNALSEAWPGASGDNLLAIEQRRQELMHSESLKLAGKAYEESSERLDRTFGTFIPAPSSISPPRVSLPLLLGRMPSEQELHNWSAAVTAPPAAGDPQTAPALDYAEAAWGLWALQSLESERDKRAAGKLKQLAVSSVEQGSGGHSPPYLLPVELRALARFSAGNDSLPAGLRLNLTMLLTCRGAAEHAAFLEGEPLVLPHLQARIDALDEQRRQIEDSAFAARLPGDDPVTLAESYEQIARDAELLRRAIVFLDSTWADLPYLLEWACVGDEARVAAAESLIDAVAAVASLLDRSPVETATLRKQVEAGEQARDSLHGSLAENVMLQAERTADHLGVLLELERLLAVPLARLDQRGALWRKYLAILKSNPRSTEPPSARGVPQHDPQQERQFAARLLDRWLAGQTRGTPEANIAATESTVPLAPADLRRRLGGFVREAERAVLIRDFWDQRYDAAGDADRLRQLLPQLDRQIRTGAPWLVLHGRATNDGRTAVAAWRQCAAHDYALWQAERALRDFLGNDDGGGLRLIESSEAKQPYFQRAADACLKAAEHVFPNKDHRHQLVEDRLVEQARLSESLSGALASIAGQVAGADPSLSPESDSIALRGLPASATGAFQQIPAGVAALHFPGGIETVRLNDAQEPPASDNDYVAWPVPAGGVFPAQVTFHRPPSGVFENLRVGYYYRGHAAAMARPVRSPVLVRTLAADAPPDTGKLTVLSSRRPVNAVVVLDCSASMEKAGWFNAACGAVNRVIRLIADTPGSSVSLVLFGHRFPEGKVEISRENYLSDYELVWQYPGQTVKELDDWLKENGKARARGYTPLLAAMKHAVDRGFAQSDAARHLIVVTDGKDYVYHDKDSYNGHDQRLQRGNAVKDALRTAGPIRLHVFDLSGGAATESLKAYVGMQAHEAVSTSIDHLERQLRESMELFNFELRGGPTPGPQAGEDYVAWTLERGSWVLRVRDYAASDAPLEILGGEALTARRDNSTTQPSIAFDQPTRPVGDGRFQQVDVPADDRRLAGNIPLPATVDVWCAAQLQAIGSGPQVFEVTFANADAKAFTPRPRETWVEITPARQAGPQVKPLPDAKPYYFCDGSFKRDQPVPVMQLEAPDWPRDGTHALVSVWFRFTSSSGRADAVSHQQHSNRFNRVPSLDPSQVLFRFQTDDSGRIIQVVESRPGDDDDAPAVVRVWADSRDGLPVRVERRSYTGGRTEHHFHFPDSLPETVIHKRIAVMPLAEWKESAAKTFPPLEVKVLD